MINNFKIGVIGAGFMAYSIVKGAVGAGILSPQQILVSDVFESQLKKFSDLGVSVTTDNDEVFTESEFVLFAVKPQNFADSVKNVKDVFPEFVISIMAGVTKEKIRSILGVKGIKIARCMPNTPCSVGKGAVGIDVSEYKDKDKSDFVINLFSSFAKVCVVKESELNAVTALSGSSPAYFYLFIKLLAESAKEYGIDENDAIALAVNTMIGSGEMIFRNSDKSLDELIASVCSKGGTTLCAIDSFNKDGLKETVKNAFDACVRRAEELEKTI